MALQVFSELDDLSQTENASAEVTVASIEHVRINAELPVIVGEVKMTQICVGYQLNGSQSEVVGMAPLILQSEISASLDESSYAFFVMAESGRSSQLG